MTRKVTITFEDSQSLTSDEIKANLLSIYGHNAHVEITPNTNSPSSYIQYGISELLTEEQTLIFFDQPEQYSKKLKTLRSSIVKKLLYILNDVIMDNEEHFSS